MGVRDQSAERFTHLFDQHYQQVYVYCRRRSDAETAADCAAETFMVAWRRRSEVPADETALGWLYGVARRVLANEFRRNRRSRRLLGRLRNTPLRPDPAPDEYVLRRDQDRRALAALARLRESDRELLQLALWEELPHDLIAERLGCSTAAVGQRIYRATRKVAAEYQRLGRGSTALKRWVQGGVS